MSTYAADMFVVHMVNWGILVGSACCPHFEDTPFLLAERIALEPVLQRSGIQSVAMMDDHRFAGNLGLDLDVRLEVPQHLVVLGLVLAEPLELDPRLACARSLPPSCELSTLCGSL